MAGSHHDAAVHTIVAGSKIHLLGATQADVINIRAGGHQAGAESLCDFWAGQADVVADDHFFCAGDLHIGAADFLCQGGVKLIRYSATKVVGLETGQVHCSLPVSGIRQDPDESERQPGHSNRYRAHWGKQTGKTGQMKPGTRPLWRVPVRCYSEAPDCSWI